MCVIQLFYYKQPSKWHAYLIEGAFLLLVFFNVLLRRIIGLQWPEESCFGHRESRKCSSRAYFVNNV